MELLLLWMAWASINLAATIAPGPAFAMTVKTAMAHNRRVGIFLSLGLGLGVAVTVTLVSCGLSLVMATSALAFEILKYIGAAYLIYLGIKALRAKKRLPENFRNGEEISATPVSDFKAFGTGFLTNLLNPKGIVFFSAMVTQFITPETPAFMIAIFALTATVIEASWFSIVTLVLTDARVKRQFMSFAHWIERVCGALLVALGLKLALSKVAS